ALSLDSHTCGCVINERQRERERERERGRRERGRRREKQEDSPNQKYPFARTREILSRDKHTPRQRERVRSQKVEPLTRFGAALAGANRNCVCILQFSGSIERNRQR